MTTCLVIRHGQSQANVDGILAGHLDSTLTDHGLDQARRVAEALREVPIRRIVTSPLSRCRATAAEVALTHPDAGPPQVEAELSEVRYGGWTGRSLADLAKDDLWAVVQATPSAVTFPAHPDHPHESMTDLSRRAWEAWERWDTEVARDHGATAVWALVSHGDVIKTLLARCLGLGLDAFQSIVVDPGSVSIVHRQGARTAVSGLNLRDDAYARLAHAPPDEQDSRAGVGAVGGGDG